MDKKAWQTIDELKNQVQQISEQQNMQKKLVHVKYVAVEFAYDHFKNGENRINDAIGHGYEVLESWKTDSGIVVVLGRYRFGAVYLGGQKMKRKNKKPENIQKLKLQDPKCMLCRLTHKDHSEKLWKMHNATVEMARCKTQHKKLWTMQIGFGPRCPALLDNDFESEIVVSSHQTGDAWRWNVVPTNLNPAEWLRPIYMSCTGCGLSLGKTEEDYADMMDGMCL